MNRKGLIELGVISLTKLIIVSAIFGLIFVAANDTAAEDYDELVKNKPFIEIVTLVPENPTTMDALTCEGNATDKDDVSLSLNVSFFNNSKIVYSRMQTTSSGVNFTEVLTGKNTTMDENWTCQARVNDSGTFVARNSSMNATISHFYLDSCYHIQEEGNYYASGSILKEDNGYECFYFNISNVNLNCGNSSMDGFGNSFFINISGSVGNQITNITIRNCNATNTIGTTSDFIFFSHVQNSTINNSLFNGINEQFYDGYRISYSNNITIANSKCNNATYCVKLIGGATTNHALTNHTTFNSTYFFQFYNTGNNFVTNSTITNTSYIADLHESSPNKIHNNLFNYTVDVRIGDDSYL